MNRREFLAANAGLFVGFVGGLGADRSGLRRVFSRDADPTHSELVDLKTQVIEIMEDQQPRSEIHDHSVRGNLICVDVEEVLEPTLERIREETVLAVVGIQSSPLYYRAIRVCFSGGEA